jgi:tripartite-type tricarboxylate transporter receptor subunit TctC
MPEMVEAGMEGMVETGNALVLPARVPEEVRNDG